jgi:arsenate reductase
MKNKKKVLFVCIGNSCRSQMAEGYARTWGSEMINASSAGTYAIGFINEPVIEVMREEGIDISGGHPKQITREMVKEADLVIALGGDPELFFPVLLKDKLITWPTPDPFGDSLERTREIRDMIKVRVSDLIIDLAKDEKANN